MSNDRPRLEFALHCIANIETVVERHGDVAVALADEAEGRAAILMALMQIGETLNRLSSAVLKERLGEEDVRGAYNVRNVIAHDYEGVNLALVELVCREKLRELRRKIEDELSTPLG